MAFDANHVARGLPICGDLSNPQILQLKNQDRASWDTREHFVTGAPPRIKQLVDLEALKIKHAHTFVKCLQTIDDGAHQAL